MLSNLLCWRSPRNTPQDDFRRLYATLSKPPPLPASLSPDVNSSTATAAAHALVVDPYHFIVCQHGVLSTSADFDNVITDLFVHHEVSVLEAAEKAAAATVASTDGSSECVKRAGCVSAGKGADACAAPDVVLARANAVDGGAKLPMTVPNTSTLTMTHTHTRSPNQVNNDQQNTMTCAPDKRAPVHAAATSADPLRADTALTAASHARRTEYKKTFKLSIEYPNQTSGRLYRSGNLRVFSPGSNNYLRSDTGTLACARKMLAETVPQIHAWLDDVQAQECQRRAQWSVYARVVNTPEAARLSAEARRPLPVCLSFMAHSFGGIIEREFLYLLLMDTTETRVQDAALYDAIVLLRRRLHTLNVSFENFLNIATPHCGAAECLWWPIYFGAWCLARLNLCQTYDELILSDAEQVLRTRLLDAPHLKVLELFRRRVLFANTHRDVLVGFGTCSLIFENLDTDHTKFIGVSARETPCAAAFADDKIEISRPITLRSFAEEAQRRYASPASPSSAASRTYTLHDLDNGAMTFDAAAHALSCAWDDDNAAAKMDEAAEEDAVNADDSDSVDSQAKLSDALSETLRPHPTFSSMSGLTASPMSVVSAASFAGTAGDDFAFATVFTVGQDVPPHVADEMSLEEVVGPCSWANEEGGEEVESEDDEDEEVGRASFNNRRRTRMSSGMLTIVVDPANASASQSDLVGSGGGAFSSTVSPISLTTRPFSVLRDYPGGEVPQRFACLAHGGSDCDSSSTSSSRRSRGSRVASVLRDPRWASEHVRFAASAVNAEVKRRLSTAASAVLGSSLIGLCEATTPSTVGGLTVSTVLQTKTDSACAPAPTTRLLPCDDIPQYRQTPRAIAARLREKLSWRVRAVRFDKPIPVGHVACLGNWAFCGQSPLLVQTVAEELLIVLE